MNTWKCWLLREDPSLARRVIDGRADDEVHADHGAWAAVKFAEGLPVELSEGAVVLVECQTLPGDDQRQFWRFCVSVGWRVDRASGRIDVRDLA